jgi:hypothetical protein
MNSSMSVDPRRVVAWQLARCAFGAALLVGAAILVATAFQIPNARPLLHAWMILAGAWAAAVVLGLVVGVAAYHLRARAGGVRLLAWSLVAPTVGVVLTLPLTLHLLVSSVMTIPATAFDDWCVISLILTGPAHITVAALSATRAIRLANGQDAYRPRSIYLWTVVVSCLPFIIFVVPPLVVAVTGLPLLPLLHLQARIARAEQPLAVQHDALPQARLIAQAARATP